MYLTSCPRPIAIPLPSRGPLVCGADCAVYTRVYTRGVRYADFRLQNLNRFLNHLLCTRPIT